MYDLGRYYYYLNRPHDDAEKAVISTKQAESCFWQVVDTSHRYRKRHALTKEERGALQWLADIYSYEFNDSNNYAKEFALYEMVGRLYSRDYMVLDFLSRRLTTTYRTPWFFNTYGKALDSVLFLHSYKTKYIKEKQILEEVYDSDQKYRLMLYRNQEKLDSAGKQLLIDSMEMADIKNREIVMSIFRTKGWLGSQDVGDKACRAMFLAIQHEEDSATFVGYYRMIKKAYRKNNLRPGDYALYIDRYNVTRRGTQIYGTQYYEDKQTGKWKLYPLQDSLQVNELRKRVGFEPLEE